jgi:hypothetical protein
VRIVANRGQPRRIASAPASSRLGIRLTAKELEIVRKASLRAGMTIAGWVRWLIGLDYPHHTYISRSDVLSREAKRRSELDQKEKQGKSAKD